MSFTQFCPPDEPFSLYLIFQNSKLISSYTTIISSFFIL